MKEQLEGKRPPISLAGGASGSASIRGLGAAFAMRKLMQFQFSISLCRRGEEANICDFPCWEENEFNLCSWSRKDKQNHGSQPALRRRRRRDVCLTLRRGVAEVIVLSVREASRSARRRHAPPLSPKQWGRPRVSTLRAKTSLVLAYYQQVVATDGCFAPPPLPLHQLAKRPS